MVSHQCRVAGYTKYLAVKAEHEVENLPGRPNPAGGKDGDHEVLGYG